MENPTTGLTKLPRSLLLLLVLSLLTGCVWLRLLRTKHHLADFDTHFSLEHTASPGGETYTLHFAKPLLSGDDILYITFAPNHRYPPRNNPPRNDAQLPPTTEPSPDKVTEIWAYLFEKEGAPARGSMHTYLQFTREGLTHILFSPTFAKLISPQQFKSICTALGQASIIKARRIVDAVVPISGESPALTRRGIETILGRPNQRGREEEGEYWLYRYRLRGKTKHVWVKLYFTSQGQCSKMQTHLAGGYVNIFFDLPSTSSQTEG